MIKRKIYNEEFPGWVEASNKFGTLILMTCKPSWQYILINFHEANSLGLESLSHVNVHDLQNTMEPVWQKRVQRAFSSEAT